MTNTPNKTHNQTWTAIELQVPLEQEEMASWCFMQIPSATGCEIATAADGNVLVRATFEEETFTLEQLEEIAALLRAHGLAIELKALNVSKIENEDWLVNWKVHFTGFAVGDRLFVTPPWESDTVQPNRTSVVIEPAMAFGTGLHQTTQFCLNAIEVENLGMRVLDVGTGSGILAIAAVLLHRNLMVTAIDTDQVAIDAARHNCELNKVESRIELIVGSTESVTDRVFDSILSNITCEDIISLLPSYRQLIKPGGIVICAGVLEEKMHKLEAAVADFGFRIGSTRLDGDWCGIILKQVG